MYQKHALGMLLVWLLLGALGSPALAYGTAVGDRARDVAGWDLVSQRVVHLDDYAGQWVFVDFWASWCGPCVHELPNMIAKTKPFVDAGKLKVITVAVDDPDTVADMRKLIRQHRMLYPVLYTYDEALADSTCYGSGVADDWWISGVPSPFLINPQGVIVASNLRGEKLAATLDYYLKTERPLTGLRGYAVVNEDRSISVFADVLNTGMEDVEVQLYTYQVKLVWNEADARYEENVVYADELIDSATVSFSGFCETTHEFRLPPDESLYVFLCVLKAKVPGTDEIIGEDGAGIWMDYDGEQISLLDVEYANGEYTIHGPMLEYYYKR